MLGLSTTILISVCIGLCGGQASNDKIRTIYNDMDMNDDGFVFFDDLQQYFAAYTSFFGVADLDYSIFELIWTTVYNDTNAVARHIFDAWDQNSTDQLIKSGDMHYLWNQIDGVPNPPTPEFLDYYYEFRPYFENLYQTAPMSPPVGK